MTLPVSVAGAQTSSLLKDTPRALVLVDPWGCGGVEPVVMALNDCEGGIVASVDCEVDDLLQYFNQNQRNKERDP